MIKRDHRLVKGLFRKFERATRSSDKQKLGQEIIEELSVHAAIEELLIYPLLKVRGGRMVDPVLNALEEHHAVKLVLSELDGMSPDDERYRAKMHVVCESVESHIEEEESKLLPYLETGLDADDRAQLATAILVSKQDVPNHPHPHAPDTPPAAEIAAMIAKIADSGRDLVRRITNRDKSVGHRRVERRAKNTARKSGRKRRTRSASAKARRRNARR
jgi:hypothetical protein